MGIAEGHTLIACVIGVSRQRIAVVVLYSDGLVADVCVHVDVGTQRRRVQRWSVESSVVI